MNALCATACIILVAAGASASAQAPASVNECTLLSDPTQLRQCVDRFRDNETGPGRPGFKPDAFAPREAASAKSSAGAAKRQAERPRVQDGRRARDTALRRGPRPGKPPSPGSGSIP